MSNEINNNEVAEVVESKPEKKVKDTPKKENIFKRVWKKFVKLCKDTVGEMKKVVWTPKAELWKNTKLVIASVLVISLAILAIDTAFSYLFTTVAGLVG